MKKRKGLAVMELAIYAIFLSMFLVGISALGSTNNTIQNNDIKDRTLMVDSALAIWFQSHGGVYPSSGNIQFLKDVNLLPSNMDLSAFSYSTQNLNTQYRLTVTFPDGNIYTSLSSKY